MKVNQEVVLNGFVSSHMINSRDVFHLLQLDQ